MKKTIFLNTAHTVE